MSRRRRDDWHATAGAPDPEDQEVMERLDATADFEARTQEAARQLAHAPGEDLVAATLRELAGAPPAPSAWRLVVPLAAMLAILLTITSVLRDDGPRHLLVGPGGEGIELLAPVGEGASPFGTFRWRAERPQDGWFVLRVYDAAQDAFAAPLYQSPRLEEPQWTAPADAVSSWPAAIRWQVQLVTPRGVQHREEAQASR